MERKCRFGTSHQSHRPPYILVSFGRRFSQTFSKESNVRNVRSSQPDMCSGKLDLDRNCALTCEYCEQCTRCADRREKGVVSSSFYSTIPCSNLRKTVRRLCEDLRTLVVSELSHRLLCKVLDHSARSALSGEISETTKDIGVEIALWAKKPCQKGEESFNG